MNETIDRTPNPNSLANLRPHWVEGQSGNPNGRPRKEFSLTEGLREYIAEQDPDRKKERRDALIEKTYQMALRGDLGAIKEIWNRLEGMPKGSETNVAVQINQYTGTESQEQEIDEYVIKRSNEMIREGKARIENNQVRSQNANK